MSDPANAPASAASASPSRTTRDVLATLLPFLRPYLGRILLALGCLVAAKLSGLAVPLVLKRLVDALDVAPRPLLVPLALLLAYGALRLAMSAFQELRTIVFARVLGALAGDVRGPEAVGSSLAEDAIVVVERSTRSPEPTWPAAMSRTEERRYGETVIWFASPDAGVGTADLGAAGIP